MRARWWMVAVAVLMAAVVGSAQLPFSENFETGAPGWVFGGWAPPHGIMWQVVDQGELFGEPAPVRAFPSPTKAAYFGNVSGGTGSYATGSPVWGELVSPGVDLGGAPFIRVKFRYYREVESFVGIGVYDWTRLYVLFDVGPAAAPIFDKDGSDPSEDAWIQFTSDLIPVPHGATQVRLVFEMNSVDAWANDYLGWLVDNVEIVAAAAPLEITTTSLRPGRVGEWYFDWLGGTGGTPPYTWSLGQGATLPARLLLDRGGRIEGIPEVAGTFPMNVVLTDQRGANVSKTLTLVIEPAWRNWRLVFVERFDDVQTPAFPPGWHVSPGALWHTTDPLGPPVAYYGRPGAFDYNTGARTRGCLTTAPWDVTDHAGEKLWVAFVHGREVEYYAGGAYDKTWVEVSFDNATWTRIWAKDSRDVSERNWTPVQVDTGLVIPAPPAGGETRVWLRFCFDSVDSLNNNYLGWAISWVAIGVPIAEPAELAIATTCPLPAGEVGVPYTIDLKATGGCPPYVWTVTGLPDGLVLDRTTGRIAGSPRVAGQFPLTVSVTDGCGTTRSVTGCMLIIGRAVTLFFENFVGDLGVLWLPEGRGLWHGTDEVMYKGTDLLPADREPAAYYGTGANNYDTAWRTTGALTSRPFALSGAAHVTVAFDYWREVEAYAAGAYDQTVVQIRFGTGPWLNVWYRDSRNASERAWTPFTSGGITAPAGATTMQIRFFFDSVDRFNNRFVGWLVDNVRVSKATSGSPLSALALPTAADRGAGVISVFNYPNPVRDVHTTTFAVRGVEAEAMRVEIFDLTGRLVYRAEAAGNELVWNTQDLTGLPLANGVYLYKVYVRVGGSWITTRVQKLVILR